MHTILHPPIALISNIGGRRGIKMEKRDNETPQVSRSIAEWVADAVFFLVLGGVVATIFYLGLLL